MITREHLEALHAIAGRHSGDDVTQDVSADMLDALSASRVIDVIRTDGALLVRLTAIGRMVVAGWAGEAEQLARRLDIPVSAVHGMIAELGEDRDAISLLHKMILARLFISEATSDGYTATMDADTATQVAAAEAKRIEVKA